MTLSRPLNDLFDLVGADPVAIATKRADEAGEDKSAACSRQVFSDATTRECSLAKESSRFVCDAARERCSEISIEAIKPRVLKKETGLGRDFNVWGRGAYAPTRACEQAAQIGRSGGDGAHKE